MPATAIDDYINSTGLSYFKGRLDTVYATQSALSTLSGRVDAIVAEGGEPNTIESVTVNGTAVTPDANKNVALTVPTATSDITNDGDGTSNFATEAYVAANGGKIDHITVNGTEQSISNKTVAITVPTKVSDLQNDGDGTSGSAFVTEAYVTTNGGKIDTISVNGTAQTITNKNVDITVPTAVSDLTNDSGFQTASDVSTAISTAVASAVKCRGSVASYSALPASGQVHGDMYDTLDTGKNYVWIVENGTGRWDEYASTIDTSVFMLKTDLVAITTAQIDALFE